jgi:hypothetical protein
MSESSRRDGAYVCEECGESFESEAALEKHVHEEGLTE